MVFYFSGRFEPIFGHAGGSRGLAVAGRYGDRPDSGAGGDEKKIFETFFGVMCPKKWIA